MGKRPFDALLAMILPPLQITFSKEKKAFGCVMVIGIEAGEDWQPNSSVAMS